MRVTRIKTAIGALAAILLAFLSVQATAYTWTGGDGSSNSWYSAGNWQGGAAPSDEPPGDYIFAASGWNATQKTIAIGGDPDAETLTFNGNVNVPLTIQISSGSFLSLSPSSSGATTISVAQTGVTHTIAGSGSATIQLSDTQQWSVDGALAVSAVISADDEYPFLPGLVKTGAGTLILSGNNLFHGPVTINQGVISVSAIANAGQACNLGRGDLTLTDGGVLSYTGTDVSTTRGFALGAGGGAIDVPTAATSLTFTGKVTETDGQAGLTKTGSGILALTGANTYTGNTTVSAGTLSLSQAYLFDAGNVSIASGGVLNLTFSSADTIHSLYFNGLEQAPGLYNASDSGGYITGSGSLLVTVGVPEPSTLALLAAGLAGLIAYARRKRRQ